MNLLIAGLFTLAPKTDLGMAPGDPAIGKGDKSVPTTINYQAYITHSSDTTALDTVADFTFRIYDSPTGGNLLWSESQSSVPVIRGILDTRLGLNAPLPPAIFYTGQTLWLEVAMGAETFSPRKALVSVGQAFHAQRADTADYALKAPGGIGDNFIQNQDTMAQPASFWISDSATVGDPSDERYARLNGEYAVYGQHDLDNFGYIGAYGTGVYGWGSTYGVYGGTVANNHGILGYQDGWRRYGVFGTSYDYAGVYGEAISVWSHSAFADTGFGMLGYAGLGIGDGPYGVYGEGPNVAVEGFGGTCGVLGAAPRGGTGGSNIGMLGVASGSDSCGVKGYGVRYGVYGFPSAPSINGTAGVYGYNSSSPTCSGLLAYKNYSGQNIGVYGGGGVFAGFFWGDVYVHGDLDVYGSKSNILKLDDGTWVTMSANESPYTEYTLRGRARLRNGQATIEFEYPYTDVISEEVPIDVIVTPQGAWSGIYVVRADRHGFTVKSETGDLNCEFTWMAIGRRKGYEDKPDYKAITEKMDKAEAAEKVFQDKLLKKAQNPDQ